MQTRSRAAPAAAVGAGAAAGVGGSQLALPDRTRSNSSRHRSKSPAGVAIGQQNPNSNVPGNLHNAETGVTPRLQRQDSQDKSKISPSVAIAARTLRSLKSGELDRSIQAAPASASGAASGGTLAAPEQAFGSLSPYFPPLQGLSRDLLPDACPLSRTGGVTNNPSPSREQPNHEEQRGAGSWSDGSQSLFDIASLDPTFRPRDPHAARPTPRMPGPGSQDGLARSVTEQCEHCYTTVTPLWRRDVVNRGRVCNACYCYQKTHNGRTRPLDEALRSREKREAQHIDPKPRKPKSKSRRRY